MTDRLLDPDEFFDFIEDLYYKGNFNKQENDTKEFINLIDTMTPMVDDSFKYGVANRLEC